MITLTTEQAQQIEEAFDKARIGLRDWELPENRYAAINAINPALATIRAARAQEQAEQEPVGELVLVHRKVLNKLGIDDEVINTVAHTPAQQEPVAKRFEKMHANGDVWITTIAAAPDLLEALQALDTLFAPIAKDTTAAQWIDKARAAIAKATGGAI